MINYLVDLLSKTPLIYLTQSFWRDEAFTYFMAMKPIHEILFLTASDFNPPLYYLLIKLWMYLFGSSEIAIRSFSLVCYAISVYVVSLILEKIFRLSNLKKIAYSLLFLINPFFLYFAFEARMYSLLLLLTISSLYVFFLKKYRVWTIFSLAGLYTHYYYAFFLLGQFFYQRIFHKNFEKKRTLQLFLLVFLGFFPWFLISFQQLISNTKSFWFHRITFQEILEIPFVLLTGYDSYQEYFKPFVFISSFISWFVMLASVFNNRYKRKSYYFYFLFLSLPFVVLFYLISFMKPVITPRYIIGFAGVYNLFIYGGIILSKRTMRYILLLGLLFVYFMFGFSQNIYRRKGNIRHQVTIIESIATKNDIICVDERYRHGYLLVSYYAKKSKIYLCMDKNIQIPKFEGSILYKDAEYIDKYPRYPNKAFIIFSDSEHDIKTIW